MKILLKTIIIDDDKIATEQLKTELAKYSMLDICGNAYTGTEGRILLLETNPDLIFLDVNMPIMDGLQTAKAIRKMGITTPIISIAAFSKKEEIEQCFESGMDDYISKPIDSKKLLEKIAMNIRPVD